MKKVFLFCYAVSVFALPTLEQTVHGDVSFASSEKTLEVTASDRAIIEWKNFSIDSSERTHFIQPSSNAIVLNRVLDPHPSEILGTLQSNGQIILVNQAGILVGQDAQIHTGSLIASTLDIHNENFKNHKLIFEESEKGKITVHGNLTSENNIFLLGHQIDVTGHIQANEQIGFISGNEVVIHPEKLSYKHQGTINPEDLFERPNITLTHASLKSDEISIFGPSITLLEKTTIDASSPSGGGDIFVGGPLRGISDSIQNASALFVGPDVEIFADALENGNGGNVILWSEHCTIVNGPVFARGGKTQGNGGFVEISSHGTLYPNGEVSTDAPNGKSGALLIDPIDVILDNTGPDSGFVAPPPFNPLTFTGNAVITYTTLQGWLVAGNDVTIETNQAAGGSGNISALPSTAPNAFVSWSTGANLVFDVRGTTGDVTIEHSFACHSTGSLSILGDGPPACAGNAIGTITIRSADPTPERYNTYFGSAAGSTIIDAPAYDLVLEVPNFPLLGGARYMAQVGYPAGFNNPGPPPDSFMTTVTGPISVTCSNITMTDSDIFFADRPFATQIGHCWATNQGQAVVPSLPVTTTSTATVTVTAHGNITMVSFLRDSYAHIGNGGHSTSVSGPSSLDGDVTVFCGGDLFMNSLPSSGAVTATVHIGNGIQDPPNGAPSFTMNGATFVAVNGTITLQASGANFNRVIIGILAPSQGGGSIGAARPAPITVRCGGDLIYNGIATTSIEQLIITHAGISALDVNGGIFVSVNGDVIMQGSSSNPNSACRIGRPAPFNFTGPSPVEVAIGGDLIMTGSNRRGGLSIGYSDDSSGNNFSSTHLVVNGDITILDGTVAGMGILSGGDVNVAVGGDINMICSNAVATNFMYLGTNDTDNAITPHTTRICTGGSFFAQNAVNSTVFIGRSLTAPVTPTFSLEMHSAQDIQLSSPITTGSGSIFISADAFLPQGALWQASGGNLTSCCFQAFPFPLSFNASTFIASPCPSFAPVASLLISSPNLPIDGQGCVSFDTSPSANPLTLTTTTGPITIYSGPMGPSGSCDLTIGTGANELNINTTSGNITIWGSTSNPSNCIRGNSFPNITIDTPITTAGSVFMTAQNNITITSNGSISTPSSVALIVDNQMPFPPLIGPGSFVMEPGSFIFGNPVYIYTALQGQNMIDGMINGVSFSAGTLYEDTPREMWCTYWCDPLPGNPFTIAYKDCLERVFMQAATIVDELLVQLHPYNEYPGWQEHFDIVWLWKNPELEPYLIRRRNLNFIKHPKSHTAN